MRATPIRIRTEAAFLSAVVAGAWLASMMFGVGTPTSARATSMLVDEAINGAKLLAEADAARRARDLTEADRLYRLAWRDPSSRAHAAQALHAIERDGFKTPVDDAALDETSKILGKAFRRFESEHFVLLSDCSRDVAVAKLQVLERAHHQYFRAVDQLGFDAIPPRHKLLCVLFAEHEMYRAFASAHDGVDAGWVAGYYAGLSNRAVFYEDHSGPNFTAATGQLDDAEARVRELNEQSAKARRERRHDEAKFIAAQAEQLGQRIQSERDRLNNQARESSIAKTIHEAIHLLAFNTGLQSRGHQYPFWLTEGLATSFETDRPNAAFGPDRSFGVREEELARSFERGSDVPLRDLICSLHPPDDDDGATEAMYAQAWSMFMYLHRTDRRALADFFADILDETPGKMTNERRAELFERRFGDIDRVERRWQSHIEKSIPAVASALQE